MAYLAPVNNVLNVWVGTIGSEDDRPVTRDDDRGIRFYFWAKDNRSIWRKLLEWGPDDALNI